MIDIDSFEEWLISALKLSCLERLLSEKVDFIIFLFTHQELLVLQAAILFHPFIGFVDVRGSKLVPGVTPMILHILYQREVKSNIYYFFPLKVDRNNFIDT